MLLENVYCSRTERREKEPWIEKKIPMRRQRMLDGDWAQINSKPVEKYKNTLIVMCCMQ